MYMENIDIESLYSAFNDLNIHKNDQTGCMRCGGTDIKSTLEGDRVCGDCGSCSSDNIDDSAEWSSFTAENQERCEYNNNTLLHSENMSTQIAYKFNMKQHNWNLLKWQRTIQLDSKDRSLIKVYNRIENACILHNINQTIINNTKFLYKFVSTLKLSRGAVREAMLASCLFYAFVHQNSPRNIDEVALIFNANPKKVNKTNKMLSSYLWHSSNYKELVLQPTNCEQIVHRYCDKINIKPNHIASIVKLANTYEHHESMIGKDCSYVTALAIYNYSIENDLSISKDDICEACFLSTVTLNKLLKNNIK